MSTSSSQSWAEESDDLLEKLNDLLCCDLPAEWILGPKGKAHFERLYGYATFLYEQKRYNQAKQLLIFLSLSNPMHFEIELAVGLCAKALGQFAEAVARFGKAALLNACDPRPIYFAAQIFEIIQEWEQAWIFFDHAYKLALGDAKMSQVLTHAHARREHCHRVLSEPVAHIRQEKSDV